MQMLQQLWQAFLAYQAKTKYAQKELEMQWVDNTRFNLGQID